MRTISNVYFDESGTHAGSRVMSMAGYWFDADQARRFSRDWAKELYRFGVSAAHQTDCAHGHGEFKEILKSQRIEFQKSLIMHTKRRTKFSIGVCLNQAEYRRIFQDVRAAPSAYTFMLLICVNKIAEEIKWREYQGRVVYNFEAGHSDANQANKFMNFMAANVCKNVDSFRYGGHAFVEKREGLPLQAADMLAWHIRHYFERSLDGHPEPRKDYVALARKCDLISVIETPHLLALRTLYANAEIIFGEKLYDPGAKMPGLDVADGIVRSFGLDPDFAYRVRTWLSKGGV